MSMYRCEVVVQWTFSGFLAVGAVVMVLASEITSTTSSTPSSNTSTTLWPPSVSECYEDLVENGRVKYCKEKCKKKYRDPDDKEQETSTDSSLKTTSSSSSPTPQNHTISCYILFDTLECLDHVACGLCSANESLIFHRSIRRQAKASRAVGGQCHGVADYMSNRSRCPPPPMPPQPDFPPTSAIDKTSVVLLILIVTILSIAIIAVIGIIFSMWWRNRSDFLLKTFREFGGGSEGAGRQRGSASSSACGYGPADFMTQKGRQARKTSPKGRGGGGGGLGMFHLSPLKNTPGEGKHQLQPKQSLEKLKHKQQQHPLPKRKAAAAAVPKISGGKKGVMKSGTKVAMTAAASSGSGNRLQPKTRSRSSTFKGGKSSAQKRSGSSSSAAAASGGSRGRGGKSGST